MAFTPLSYTASPRGLILVVAGPPGTGKSTLCGQAIPEGKTLLIALLAKELSSWLYTVHKPDYVLIEDTDWKPSREQYVATGFDQFVKVIEELHQDTTYQTVIVDPGTELGELGWHKALSVTGYTGNGKAEGWAPYDQLDDYLSQAIRSLVSLSLKGKNVLITWHTQPAKPDQEVSVGEGPNRHKTVKASADHQAEGTEYEGKVLPMIRGRFRRRLNALVPTFIYTDITYKAERQGMQIQTIPQYVLQVRTDPERHAKIPGPLPPVPVIPNDWKQLKTLLTSLNRKE
jgi:hypothetical protein